MAVFFRSFFRDFCTDRIDNYLCFGHYVGAIMRIFTWRQRGVVLLVTVLTIGLFVLVGWGIGTLLDQSRAGIFIAVLVSYPFTQWALVKAIGRTHLYETHLDAKDEISN